MLAHVSHAGEASNPDASSGPSIPVLVDPSIDGVNGSWELVEGPAAQLIVSSRCAGSLQQAWQAGFIFRRAAMKDDATWRATVLVISGGSGVAKKNGI
ncbi:hypothetical protein G7046_g6896 [Stylonectria norvegica]|nr:hypothetical protein G7046_g6896 [Stylonectria norvegica]